MSGTYGRSMFSFIRSLQIFFQSVCTILYPPTMNESSCCSTSSPAFDAVSVLDFGHSNRCVVVSLCSFNLPVSDDIWCGTYFHICFNFLKWSYRNLILIGGGHQEDITAGWPDDCTWVMRGSSSLPVSLVCTVRLQFPQWELFQGHSLERGMCWWDHLDGICY